MQYGEVRQAHFLERPNRFIAHVELEGETVVCHVKNTGRCRELLVRGATVYLERGTNPARRTAWDLIAVEKGHRLINMDAQAPNRIFAQWIHQQEPEITVHPEYRYGDSRLDFCLERPEGLHLVEVKGVTLEREGRDIGFALTALYPSEDGKCFVMEFCVLPEFRGGGTGTACARLLLDWAADRGAQYGELNAADPRRIRFWSRLGFRPNGRDEWGEPLMLRPPEQALSITVELLQDPADWQLRKLENGYLSEIGEPLLTEESTERLRAAVEQGHIRFLLAYRGCRAVGMCSVAENFSTFCCGPVAVLEDLYVEPVFRRQGIARQLIRSAQALCRERGVGSLTVCCAPCDEAMYQALGFNVPLGVSRSCLL